MMILFVSNAASCQDSIDVRPLNAKKDLRYYFSKDTTVHSSKAAHLDFQLDFRNSFIRDFPVDIYGGNIGMVFRKRYRVGAGYYLISHNFSDHLLGIRPSNGLPYTDKKGVPVPISKLGKEPYTPASQKLSVNYGCISFTYRFFTSRIIDLYVPLEVGYGTFSERLSDPLGNDFSNLKKIPAPSSGSFWPAQIGFMDIIKAHKWFYLLSAIGYRKTVSQHFDTQSDFTNFESQFEGYYYRLGVQVQIGKIWKAAHHKKEDIKEIGVSK